MRTRGNCSSPSRRASGLAWFGALAALTAPIAFAGAPGTWSNTGPLGRARDAFTLTAIDGGRALAAGGQGQDPVPHGYKTVNLSSAETYDLATGRWAAVPPMAGIRFQHEAVALADGRVMVLGGLDGTATGGPLRTVEIYDPASNSWTPAAPMGTGRYFFTATRLGDGRVLVAGGCIAYGCAAGTTAAEIFNPATGTWTSTGNMGIVRANHTATLLQDGRVVVAGADNVAYDSSEIYDPATGTWSDAGLLNEGRIGHAATLLPTGQVLVAGGSNTWGAIVATVETNDVATPAWAFAGDMIDPRQYHQLVTLNNGRALAIGGQRVVLHSFVDIARCETFDAAAGTWSATGSMAVPRESHRAVVLSNGQVLVAGGIDGTSGLFTAASELYTPDAARSYTETFDGAPEAAPLDAAGWHLVAGTGNVAGVSPDFCVDDAIDVAKISALNDAGSTFATAHAFIENDVLPADATAGGRGDALLYTNEFLGPQNASFIDVNGANVELDYANGDASNAGPSLQFAFRLASGAWFLYETPLAGNTSGAVTHGLMSPLPINSTFVFVPLAVDPTNVAGGARLVPDPASRRTLSTAELSQVTAVGVYSGPAPRDVSPTRIDNYRISNFSVGCAPAPVGGLRVAALPGGVARVTWGPATRATSYDAVRGALETLEATHGDFAAATGACLANNLPATSLDDAARPPAGGGFWYTVRGSGCAGGSYDDGAVSQQGSRDAGILASGNTCP